MMFFITDYRFNNFYRKNLPTKWLDVLILLNAMEKPIAKVSIVRAIWGFDKPNQIIMRGYQSKLFRSMHAAGLIHYTRGKGWEIAEDGVKLLSKIVDEYELKQDVPLVKPILHKTFWGTYLPDHIIKYNVYRNNVKEAYNILEEEIENEISRNANKQLNNELLAEAISKITLKYLNNPNRDIPDILKEVANELRY